MDFLLLLLACLQSPAPDKALEANDESMGPSISDDGRFVVFESLASNFVAGDQRGTWDVFLLDRDNGHVTRISDDSPSPARAARISGDGRWIVYKLGGSPRKPLEQQPWGPKVECPWTVILHDRGSGSVQALGAATDTYDLASSPDSPSISRDGARVVFTSQEGEWLVARLFERASGESMIVFTTPQGQLPGCDVSGPSLSPNGRYLVVTTNVSGVQSVDELIRHVLLRDLMTGTQQCVSVLAEHRFFADRYGDARVSDDGRYVAYNPGSGWESLAVGFVSDCKTSEVGRLLPQLPDDPTRPDQGPALVTWLSAEGRLAVVGALGGIAQPDSAAAPRQDGVYLRDLVAQTWTNVGLAIDGALANQGASEGTASRDASTIAFSSAASNLVLRDRNGAHDIFFHDRASGRTTRVVPHEVVELAVGAPSEQPDGESVRPSISDDGAFVVFASLASNFVRGDHPGTWDLFLYECATGAVSLLNNGGNGACGAPTISGNGRWIAYWEHVFPEPWNDGRGDWTVTLQERATGAIQRIPGCKPLRTGWLLNDSISISRDGSRIAFEAQGASGAVVKWYDRAGGTPETAGSVDADPATGLPRGSPSISADGRFITFLARASATDPANETCGVSIHDLEKRTTRSVSGLMASAGLAGAPSNPRLSADGRFVAFDHGEELADPQAGFLADLLENRLESLLAARKPDAFSISWLSPNGEHVLVSSTGAAFLAGPPPASPQVFLHAVDSDVWTPISRSADGTFGNLASGDAVASRDLTRIVFSSLADNLVPEDYNGTRDIFVFERKSGRITRILASVGHSSA